MLKYILSMYVGGTMQLIESYWKIMGKREWGKEKAIERVNSISVQFMHAWNTMCNPFVQLIYTKNVYLKKQIFLFSRKQNLFLIYTPINNV
jgi:hypothetical protein